MHIWGEVGSLFIILLQISNWVRQWKNSENRSIFSKDMDKSIVTPFLTHSVVYILINFFFTTMAFGELILLCFSRKANYNYLLVKVIIINTNYYYCYHYCYHNNNNNDNNNNNNHYFQPQPQSPLLFSIFWLTGQFFGVRLHEAAIHINKSSVRVRVRFAPVIPNNASDYQANGLLSDYIGWTNGLMDYRANGLGLGLRVG